MLSPPPHLTTFRPSPTTVSFTVSTASSSRLQHHLLLFLRLVAGLSTLLVVLARGLASPPKFLFPLARYVTALSWTVVGPVVVGSIFVVFRRFHTGTRSTYEFLSYMCFLDLLYSMSIGFSLRVLFRGNIINLFPERAFN